MKNDYKKLINSGYKNTILESFNDDHHYGVLGKPIKREMYGSKEHFHDSKLNSIIETIEFFKNNR